MFLDLSEENFLAAREVLCLYEKISGAKLNMDKTTLMVTDDLPAPAWLASTGCKAAQPGEVVRYLGSPIGVQISIATETEYLLGKVRKRIRH